MFSSMVTSVYLARTAGRMLGSDEADASVRGWRIGSVLVHVSQLSGFRVPDASVRGWYHSESGPIRTGVKNRLRSPTRVATLRSSVWRIGSAPFSYMSCKYVLDKSHCWFMKRGPLQCYKTVLILETPVWVAGAAESMKLGKIVIGASNKSGRRCKLSDEMNLIYLMYLDLTC